MKCRCILRSPTRAVPTSSFPGQDPFCMSQYSMEILCSPSLFLTEDVLECFLLITSRFSWKWRAVDRDSKTDAESERPWFQCRHVGQGLVFCTWCKHEPIRCRHSKSTLNLLSLLFHCLQSSFTFLRTSKFEGGLYGEGKRVISSIVSLYTESWKIMKAPAIIVFIAITKGSVIRIHNPITTHNTKYRFQETFLNNPF
jgi:hypothetical protein